MNNANISMFQMFLKEPRPEASTLAVLNSILSFGIESIDVRIEGAAGVAQVSEHPHGYTQSWLVSWPAKFKAPVSYQDLARHVAMTLDVQVLLEPDAEESWLVFSSDGGARELSVEYLGNL